MFGAMVAVGILFGGEAMAGGLDKTQQKAFIAEAKAAYPGTVWALKELPVNTGITMNVAWISATTEVRPTGFKIEAEAAMSATIGSAKSVWYGVHPYATLELADVKHDDGMFILTFDGVGASKGHDTKIEVWDATSIGQVKAVLDELVTTTDPVDASWPEDVRRAIANRTLVNGMTKRQAYLVLGEPIGSSTREEGGKKIEIWNPRQTNGMKIGYGMSVDNTGFPTEIRFVDGVLEGVATTVGGGVSLE